MLSFSTPFLVSSMLTILLCCWYHAVFKNTGSGVQVDLESNNAPTLTGCVALDKLLNLSETQFPYL